MEVSLDLGLVLDGDGPGVLSEHVDLSEVDLGHADFDDRSDRVGDDVDGLGRVVMGPHDVNCQGQRDLAQLLG